MPKKSKTPGSLVTDAGRILKDAWEQICDSAQERAPRDMVTEPLRSEIASTVNARTKSYRYVLLTQLCAKLANQSLDCRCLQTARGGVGAFDARSIAHKVVVPFDQANNNVLGGSPEPYVNNPLRVPEVSEAFRWQQKNKEDWDCLTNVLEVVQQKASPKFTRRTFDQVLVEVYRRLATVNVAYPAPRRISLEDSLAILSKLLRERSGGDRLLAATSALFTVIGKRFRLYSEVRRSRITAADAATGMLADLECVSDSGQIVLVVEVKDRQLTITQIQSKMTGIRQKRVSEIFFVAQGGVKKSDRPQVRSLISREFTGGHNLYVTDISSLSETALSLLGETGRVEFLREIGSHLDQYNSDIATRRAWAQLLSGV